ncbi:hypothetical protein ARAF_0100 [Arsenophonus endosymbiont of Aleurodicus floccissimus]|nr:hypothetical protein ARAF_0100 [Arsenophonus endosymbiont of Aleurodicus floccissimus]
MMVGSLANASNQQGDFTQNAATNAGVNLATQGLLSAAEKGGSEGDNGIKRRYLSTGSTEDYHG